MSRSTDLSVEAAAFNASVKLSISTLARAGGKQTKVRFYLSELIVNQP